MFFLFCQKLGCAIARNSMILQEMEFCFLTMIGKKLAKFSITPSLVILSQLAAPEPINQSTQIYPTNPLS